jgi:hypothetical protein
MIISLPELLGQRMDLSREQRDEIRELKIEVAKLGATLAELPSNVQKALDLRARKMSRSASWTAEYGEDRRHLCRW